MPKKKASTKQPVAISKFRTRWRHVAKIDEMIRSRQRPNANEMAERLEVSWRTVMRDIEFMRQELGAPVAFDRKANGFYYTERNWSLPNIRLTESDLLAICIAERVVEGFGDTPLADALRSAFSKITAGLHNEVEASIADLLIRYDFTMNGVAIIRDGVLNTFQQAIRENRQVKMIYFSAHYEEEYEYTVEPYLLMMRDGAWYVAARDTAQKDKVPLFNLSRVRNLKLLNSEFEYTLSDFDRKKFMHEMGRTFHGKNSHDVVVEFTGPAAFYVAERIWHPGQKLRHLRGGRLMFEVSVPNLWDIIPWILRWGGDAKVIKPPELVGLIAEQARKMTDTYQVS